jgi:hypothetical protein
MRVFLFLPDMKIALIIGNVEKFSNCLWTLPNQLAEKLKALGFVVR